MREVVVGEPHKVEVREVLVPELSEENEILIQMKSVGVCGSDYHIYHDLNPRSTYPRIPEYENAGVVVKTGSVVTNAKVSDHVIVDLISTYGACYQCRIGRKDVCEHVRVRSSGANGGWGEYFTAPVSEVYKIDDPVDWKDAVSVEPYAIGAHCTDRIRTASENVIFILSAGTVGSTTLQICKTKGYQMVICYDIDDVFLQRAKEYGANHVINSKTEDVAKRVAEVTRNHGVTVAFGSACFPRSLIMHMQPGILYNAGRMVPLGFSTAEEEITQATINQRELDVVGSRILCFQSEPTIQRMENGEFNIGRVATMFIPFDEISKVFYYMDHPYTESKRMVILFG